MSEVPELIEGIRRAVFGPDGLVGRVEPWRLVVPSRAQFEEEVVPGLRVIPEPGSESRASFERTQRFIGELFDREGWWSVPEPDFSHELSADLIDFLRVERNLQPNYYCPAVEGLREIRGPAESLVLMSMGGAVASFDRDLGPDDLDEFPWVTTDIVRTLAEFPFVEVFAYEYADWIIPGSGPHAGRVIFKNTDGPFDERAPSIVELCRPILRLAERGLIVPDPEPKIRYPFAVYIGTPDDAYDAGLTSNVDFFLG